MVQPWSHIIHNKNPSERAIQDVKGVAETIVDRTGANSREWFKALEYQNYLHNRDKVWKQGLKLHRVKHLTYLPCKSLPDGKKCYIYSLMNLFLIQKRVLHFL